MADNTKIEWADATVNAVNGCSVVSPGCTNCYAMRLAGTRMKHHPTRAGLTIDTKAGPVWNGDVRLNEAALLQPLAWKRPRHIFWNAHGDLFHEKVPDEWIDRVFAVCALTPHHKHMILTKRSARMRGFLSAPMLRKQMRGDFIRQIAMDNGLGPHIPAAMWAEQPLPNVWLGVSVEDQQRADERIPDLLATPAAVRFLSCEPLLSSVDLTSIQLPGFPPLSAFDATNWTGGGIDWVIAGGESGPGARPMHPDWVRSLRDQCKDAGVAFHFKQWGEWAPSPSDFAGITFCEGTGPACVAWPDGTVRYGNAEEHGGPGRMLRRTGKRVAGRLLDGVQHDGVPA